MGGNSDGRRCGFRAFAVQSKDPGYRPANGLRRGVMKNSGTPTPSLRQPDAAKQDRFVWHPVAKAVDGSGGEFGAAAAVSIASVHPDRPAVAALRAAFATAALGRSFRIGDADGSPAPSVRPTFETLTSGTSGAPRRIVRSQASWIASFNVNAALFGIGPTSRVAVLGRLIHSLALYGALEALHLGATVHLLDGLRPDRQRNALATKRVQILYATPAQLRLMFEAPGPVLPDLRFVLVGGSKLDPVLRAALYHTCPNASIREFYGAAEASFITLADDATPEAAVGRPYPGVGLDMRDPGGASVRDGELGQIWVKSPYLALGYGAPDSKGAIWKDGWLSVGEYGRLIDGHLTLTGRSSRMVTVADQNVFPEEIENFIITLHGVTRAAVLPVSDPLRGAVLVAVVMGDRSQEAEILAQLRQTFGALKAPRRLLWRADWPMLPSGKTDLAALQRSLA